MACAIIKEYLREMPNPLLTEALYDEWILIESML